jgi:hypothetical protein
LRGSARWGPTRKGCHMQDHELPTHSGRREHIDIDGDGGVSVSRCRDYVKVNCWGGNAGPLGCTTNLTPDAALALAADLTTFALSARLYGQVEGVRG